MFVTFNVVAPDISIDVIPLQPLNIFFIFVTFDVLNLDTSSAVSLLQPLNIEFIFVTADVSTVHLSIDVTTPCLSNIYDKSIIAVSSGLSHLHLPSASGVIVYLVLQAPPTHILKLPVAVPSIYSPPSPAAPPISLLLI